MIYQMDMVDTDGHVKVFNARAAPVDALWLGRDAAGAQMSRLRVVYLAALTSEGWGGRLRGRHVEVMSPFITGIIQPEATSGKRT